MVDITVDESAGKLLLKVPLFNKTIKGRIQHVAEDDNNKLIENIKECNLDCS